MALWLHSFLSTHREPIPLSVEKYKELSGTKEKSLAGFRMRLKAALNKLKECGIIDSFELKNDLIYVTRSRTKQIAA